MTIRLEWEDLVRARVPVAPRHVFADSPSELARVLDPAMNLCIWRRAIGTGLAAWLDEVVETVDVHAQMELDGANPDASGLLHALPAGAHRDALRADIELLARQYQSLVQSPRVLATFARVTHDMCRRFHVDAVGIRGLCTYAGAGTQWVPEPAALRGGLGKQGLSLRDTNLAVVPHEGEVRSFERGWFGLLKGDAWPGNKGLGAIHRSPPVSDVGGRRLLLKLDVDPGRRLRA